MTPLTFTAVVTCHDASPSPILTQLLEQTRRPDEILIYCSGELDSKTLELLEDVEGITFFIVPNREDWGHEKRARGVADATGDALGFFNHDDAYDKTYIEKLMAALEKGAGAAFCEWVGRNRPPGGVTQFKLASSTSGNWIGRTAIIRRVGYRDRSYIADGILIESVRKTGARISRIPEVLYEHR